MTYTCIIPLRSHDDGRYLRYALRSLASHGITRCILVGGKPRWYVGDHIAHPDYTHDRKEENIRDKVMAGCRAFHVEQFLFANDDHMVLQPGPFNHNKGLISETFKGRNPNGSYARLLVNTINRYGDVANADIHGPLLMTSEGMERTIFEWPRFGYGFKTAYCQENGVITEPYEDIKLDRPADVSGRIYFSTSDIYPVKALEKIFPNVCKFEAGYIP